MKSSSASGHAATRRERGQVVVLFALLIPIFFAMGAIVLDIGNWYVHKRHLQTQVDAAVLAAGSQFTGCPRDPIGANVNIRTVALGYAGDTSRPGRANPAAPITSMNQQVQEPDDVRVVLNSDEYWHPTDGYFPGSNGYGRDDTIATPGDPCATRFLDAKATDEDAPLLWGLIPVSPSPKAKAKVEIRQVESFAGSGLLPFYVLEARPLSVYALFVNENTGTVFDAQRLVPADDESLPFSEWETEPGLNERVTFDGLNVNTGIVILVSSDDPNPSSSGTLAQICGQSPLNRSLACYGTGSEGLSFIHGYSGGFTGSVASPQIRQVELGATGCPATDHSAPHFTLSGGAGCTAVVRAVIDFGLTGDPRPLSAACATVNGGNFTWSAGGIGGTRGTWTGTISLPSSSGRQQVNLTVRSGNRQQGGSGNCHNNQPNSNTYTKVAAAYVANDASGPVEYLKLEADGLADANSIETNDASTPFYNYTVTVGLPKPLSIANWDDDPILLRDTTGPSQYRTWDCDGHPDTELRETFIGGCNVPYSLNYDDHDGDGDKEWRDIECATSKPTPPPDCVLTGQGMTVGNFSPGVDARWRSNTDPSLGEVPCYRNNWPQTQAQADDFFDNVRYAGDPRYVSLLVTRHYPPTPGHDLMPVKYWAGFYVTGWTPHGAGTPACPDNDPAPPGASTNASLWGYYVNLVHQSSPDIEPSDRLCEFGDDPSHCVAVLVE